MATYSLTSPHNTTSEVLKRMLIALSHFLLPNNCDISPTRKMFRGIVAQIGADRDFLQKRAQAMDEWHRWKMHQGGSWEHLSLCKRRILIIWVWKHIVGTTFWVVGCQQLIRKSNLKNKHTGSPYLPPPRLSASTRKEEMFLGKLTFFWLDWRILKVLTVNQLEKLVTIQNHLGTELGRVDYGKILSWRHMGEDVDNEDKSPPSSSSSGRTGPEHKVDNLTCSSPPASATSRAFPQRQGHRGEEHTLCTQRWTSWGSLGGPRTSWGCTAWERWPCRRLALLVTSSWCTCLAGRTYK